MSKFMIVKNISEINLTEKWVDSKKFKPGKVVDQDGNSEVILTSYSEHLYRLIAKKNEIFRV